MTFTIPMYNVSKLQVSKLPMVTLIFMNRPLHLSVMDCVMQVKYLQIAKKSSSYNPYRWVRYVTQANSYVARI